MGAQMKIETIDLGFMGTEEIIASFLLVGEGSAAIVETGPTTCMENLMRGLEGHGVAPEDVAQVLLTHVHLDHAGASGNLVEVLPNATFYVHEVGRPHVVDPSKLVKSATRIYGERMEELWGEIRPVPEDRLVSLSGGEEIEVAGGLLTAHYTPGHAYHHLAFHEPDSGALFAGDVAGIRLPGQSYVRPPTPPPEVDIEAWRRSIGEIRELAPTSICPTHFGRFEDVERHLSELEQRLEHWLLFVEERMDEGASRDEISFELENMGDEELLREGASPGDTDRYSLSGNYEMLVAGIMRYVQRQQEKK
ncbi:MBL fold metallo-hydrolase [Rubrobacter marinus]|uniref:MBL fold metallo-hydrolase n=2 Tax=Rubrobacter marinus TaxID=2653852 RepID=A0A6G8PUG9_9ACTN|nr:MBL fold metallo-hydrolase [Rubrobacter marinus]